MPQWRTWALGPSRQPCAEHVAGGVAAARQTHRGVLANPALRETQVSSPRERRPAVDAAGVIVAVGDADGNPRGVGQLEHETAIVMDVTVHDVR